MITIEDIQLDVSNKSALTQAVGVKDILSISENGLIVSNESALTQAVGFIYLVQMRALPPRFQ